MLITMVYFVGPIYFQAAKGESPVLAGVYSLPLSFTVAPCAILCGTLVARAGTYKTINVRFYYSFLLLSRPLIRIFTSKHRL